MVRLMLVLCMMVSLPLFGQYKVDTTIINEAYTSYVNKELGQALYVKYRLYQGGGKCQRATNWVNDTKLTLVNENQYKGTLYDKGHLANAEDFAYNCHLDSLTFRDYNRLPQTRKLNRGVWKISETEIRKMSQTDSLMVYSGGYWGVTNNTVNGMKIPSVCWKVVYSLSLKKVVYCALFYNNDTPVKTDTNLGSLELMLGYSLGVYTENKKKKK
jgi:endonuclease G